MMLQIQGRGGKTLFSGEEYDRTPNFPLHMVVYIGYSGDNVHINFKTNSTKSNNTTPCKPSVTHQQSFKPTQHSQTMRKRGFNIHQ